MALWCREAHSRCRIAIDFRDPIWRFTIAVVAQSSPAAFLRSSASYTVIEGPFGSLDLTKGVVDDVARRAAHHTGKANTNFEARDAESRVGDGFFVSCACACAKALR
jgi:hypothetical protein